MIFVEDEAVIPFLAPMEGWCDQADRLLRVEVNVIKGGLVAGCHKYAWYKKLSVSSHNHG